VDDDGLVLIGRFGRPRGVDGEIWVVPLTDYPQRFVGLREVTVARWDGWVRLPIASARLVGGRPVLRLEAVGSPEEARRYTNCELAVGRDELFELPQGTHYVFDLVGCEVFESSTGEKLGELSEVHKYPANDVYEVRVTSGGTLEVPVVSAFVKQIDIEKKRIEIDTAGLDRDELP
jgi:16S rRNA processing protein RimM